MYSNSSASHLMTYFDTVHHGIIDPPHLRMSKLDPSGSRPTDPIDAVHVASKEDRQRQQLIAVTDGLDPFNAVKSVRIAISYSFVPMTTLSKKKK